jgi:hypothetical protein
VAALISTTPSASILIYDFTGTVTDAGNIAGVSASLDDTIIGGSLTIHQHQIATPVTPQAVNISILVSPPH